MIRPAIVLALLLSSALMMRGVASDWRKGPPAPADGAAKKSAPATVDLAPLPQVKPLQPIVPGILPDLKNGYLFNQERTLATESKSSAPPAEEKVEEPKEEIPPGLPTKIDDVTYTGSLIAENFQRALIVYKEAEKPKTPPPAQPASHAAKPEKGKGSSKTPSKPAAKPAAPSPAAAGGGAEKRAQVEVGDVLDGYTVAEILPEKLVFSKGDEFIEKLLHDPEKKRQAPDPRPGAPGGATPPGGAPTRPAGVQSMTIGGTAPPVPAPGTPAPPVPGAVNPTPPPAPTPAAPPVPPAPAASPAIKRPSAPAATGATGATPPAPPVRRMVVTRQPSTSPRPDTSRVIRQSQSEAEDVGAPPGFPQPSGAAEEAVEAPPVMEGN